LSFWTATTAATAPRCSLLSRARFHSDVVLFGKLADPGVMLLQNLESIRRLARFQAGSAATPSPLSFLECDSVSSWEQIAPPRRPTNITVDALFGTVLSRPLEGVYLKVVEHLAMLKKAEIEFGHTAADSVDRHSFRT